MYKIIYVKRNAIIKEKGNEKNMYNKFINLLNDADVTTIYLYNTQGNIINTFTR